MSPYIGRVFVSISSNEPSIVLIISPCQIQEDQFNTITIFSSEVNLKFIDKNYFLSKYSTYFLELEYITWLS